MDRHDPVAPRDDRRSARHTSDFDFRRPTKLGRDVLRVLELGHETFARRLSTGWGSELRSIVQVEPLGMDQTSYDDHIRSMPNPNVVLAIALRPLPGLVVIDCNVQLALQMVERLLGAAPTPGVAAPRRPSEVEADLIAFVAQQAVSALTETLQPLVDVELRAELESIEFNPQLVQVAAPSDMSLLLSYRVGVTGGLDANGFLTLAYPAPVLNSLLELLEMRRTGEDEAAHDDRARGAVASTLSEVGLTLAMQLNTSSVPASDIAALQVGDVLRLDHRVDAPARGVVGGEDVLLAHLGRRGSRAAVHVREWIATPPLVPVEPPPSRRSTDLAQVSDPLTDRRSDGSPPVAPTVASPTTPVMEPAS